MTDEILPHETATPKVVVLPLLLAHCPTGIQKAPKLTHEQSYALYRTYIICKTLTVMLLGLCLFTQWKWLCAVIPTQYHSWLRHCGKDGRLLVRFPIRSLRSLIDLILLAALCPRDRPSL
jgi:hypothetical protein